MASNGAPRAKPNNGAPRAKPNNGAPRAKRINLALQGGGAHGAFTWGVLDRLLEDERIAIEGISGTSAGAMNAAVLAQGHQRGGAAGAREALDAFWRRVSEFSTFSPYRTNPIDKWFGNWNIDRSAGVMWWNMVNHMFSPYDLNPFHFDPLRDVLADSIDFASLHACDHIKLFISATSVRTGKIRVFEKDEVTIEALLASACLPNVSQAIEIGGEPYWDGGYMGNPAIYPLIYNCQSHDVVIVQINPLIRDGTPRSAIEIGDRLNEITFNGALRGEMRAIAFVQKLIDDDSLTGKGVDRLKRMHVHMIGDEEHMRALGTASKFNAGYDFLLALKAFGRDRTAAWLDENFGAIGRRSSIDIREMFL